MAPMARSTLFPPLACAVLGLLLFMAGADAQTPKPPKVPKPKKVKCHQKKLFPHCAGIQMLCPAACPKSCLVDCQTCSPVCQCNKPGGVCEDPRFVGGDGITFYFHGQKNSDFCLLSDSNLHINAHFIGLRNGNMTRDFTWIQSIAVLFDDHRLYIGAQRTVTWDDSVNRLMIAFDDKPVSLPTREGATWMSSDVPTVTVSRSSDTNAVTIKVDGRFKISASVVPITEEDSRVHRYGVTSDDCFAHLELGFKFYSITGEVDGVLGQTYRDDYVSRVEVSATMPVMGGDRKFKTSSLYAADCSVARFGYRGDGIAMAKQQDDVTCGSGIRGRGIVCMK